MEIYDSNTGDILADILRVNLDRVKAAAGNNE